jgi:hypothetical protein
MQLSQIITINNIMQKVLYYTQSENYHPVKSIINSSLVYLCISNGNIFYYTKLWIPIFIFIRCDNFTILSNNTRNVKYCGSYIAISLFRNYQHFLYLI